MDEIEVRNKGEVSPENRLGTGQTGLAGNGNVPPADHGFQGTRTCNPLLPTAVRGDVFGVMMTPF
jgi:hypothetical protein